MSPELGYNTNLLEAIPGCWKSVQRKAMAPVLQGL